MEKVIERFFSYIKMDTKSNEDSTTCPSTSGQLELGKKLVQELKDMGIENAHQDKDGYIYASLKGNAEGVKPMGLIAHMDTAPDLDGKCINPRILDYKGGDIKLNDEYTMTVKEFPSLKELEGQRLITTDGTTLLGADDKAGVTIIMETVKYYVEHPEIKRGDLKIAFTPDEEIGRGADLFDVEKFGADFAYTVDGGPIGELEYENFNAASARIEIKGKNVHPGSAKDIMINASLVAMELHSMLPVDQRPEYTSGYEGFFLLTDISGVVDECKLFYIIRDHSMEKFNKKKDLLEQAVAFINSKYGNIASLEMKDSYYNMREKIEPHMEIIDLAKEAFDQVGVIPNISPIRGGTDGSRLSYMGLPTPNLFTGGYNFHGRFEFLSIDQLEKAIEVVKKIVELNAR